MDDFDRHQIQEHRDSYQTEASLCNLKVIEFTHESFHWNDYIGKYHINFICAKGSAYFSSSNVFYQVGQSDYVAWSVDMEISDVWFSKDFNGRFLLTSRNFLIENNPQSLWATKGYLLIKSSPVIHLSKADFQLLNNDMDAIERRQSDTSHLFTKEILGNYLKIYLFDLWDICKTEISRNDSLNGNSASIFSRFLGLVQQNALTRRDVSYYATELCLTPKYLSEVSRRASGKSALYWINGYAVQEIMALLQKTNLTIAEISEKCCFFSPSHFSRYFKKFLGISPTEYRQKIENRDIPET